jgi:hypothetical protein
VRVKKFMVLYMAPVAAMDQMMQQMQNSTPEQRQAGMEEWNKWSRKYEDAIVDMGAPLGRSKHITSDGRVSDHRNELGGYSLVEGESADAVAKMFVGHPHLNWMKDASIEIVEVMPMEGM